uniref:nucleolar protein 6 n=1 Tax=Myxine glutinosa TaxID=7769 RepID=UPI00358F8AAB
MVRGTAVTNKDGLNKLGVLVNKPKSKSKGGIMTVSRMRNAPGRRGGGIHFLPRRKVKVIEIRGAKGKSVELVKQKSDVKNGEPAAEDVRFDQVKNEAKNKMEGSEVVMENMEVEANGDESAGRVGETRARGPPQDEELLEVPVVDPEFATEVDPGRERLLRLQVEELLKEVKLTEKRRAGIDEFVQVLRGLLADLPTLPPVQLDDTSWLPAGLCVPWPPGPALPSGVRMSLGPPAEVKIVGSYATSEVIRPDICIDLMLTMPKGSLQERDDLNQRYLRKRAVYLAFLAAHLKEERRLGNLKYTWLSGNCLKPALLVSSTGKNIRNISFRLLPRAGLERFKPSRFHPIRNNVRPSWLSVAAQDTDIATATSSTEPLPPTPCYNAAVLNDLFLEKHTRLILETFSSAPACRDGLILTRIWLHQRQLHQGRGAFSGFLAAMLAAYLVSTGQLSFGFDSWQVFRRLLSHLATSDWTKQGITFVKNLTLGMPILQDFHTVYDVVFVDPTGYVNLCADMTAATYQRVSREAQHALSVIKDSLVNPLQTLLLSSCPFVLSFDHIFSVKAGHMPAASERLAPNKARLDYGGDFVAASLSPLCKLLSRGLGSRVHILDHMLIPPPQWELNDLPPSPDHMGIVTFGLTFDTACAFSVLERGPEADMPEVKPFRELWGPRAELRRFPDGGVCEAVLWSPGVTVAQRRLVPKLIVEHLLCLHGGIPASAITYMGGFLDPILQSRIKGIEEGTGEEQLTSIIQSFDELCRQLRGLEGLPLVVTATVGTHPALRHTEVFPPHPTWLNPKSCCTSGTCDSLAPDPNKPCPAYVPAITAQLRLEGSGRWPTCLSAIARIRAAFHIRLATLLRQSHALVCQVSQSHVDVYKAGLVFRLSVVASRELTVQRGDGGDAERAAELVKDTCYTPLHGSHICGLQGEFPAFSSGCRLARRWLAAHLLSDHVPVEAIELVAARVCLHSIGHQPPGSPEAVFLQILFLLANFDWQSAPLLINLGRPFKQNEVHSIESSFLESRESLPAMFIGTPFIPRSSWTTKHPTPQILRRLVLLARESLRIIQAAMIQPLPDTDIWQAFRPPLSLYDALIYLLPWHLPRHAEALDKPAVLLPRGVQPAPSGLSLPQLPPVQYDPVEQFLKELRAAYDDFALFFHDRHGGDVIGVLWKPQAFLGYPFKPTHAAARNPVDSTATSTSGISTSACISANMATILADVELLGHGLVRCVESPKNGSCIGDGEQ